MDKLDSYDKKILYELDIDARASASKIAKMIRLPKETVNFRIKRLVKEDYITNFYAIINASSLGYQYHKIFLRFHKIPPEKEQEIIDYLKSEKRCVNLRVQEGYYDISFLTMNRHPAELRSFLQGFYTKFGSFILDKSINTIFATHKLSQKILFSGKSERKSFSHGEPNNYVMDKIDLAIVKELSNNSRMKLTDLAEKIKISSKLIKYHMNRLEKNNVLVSYSAALNLSKLNFEIIQIDITLKDSKCIPGIIEFFDETNTCVFAYELLGKYDLSIELNIVSDVQLREIMKNFREKFIQHYVFYDISHVYQNYVINWSPFEAYSDSA